MTSPSTAPHNAPFMYYTLFWFWASIYILIEELIKSNQICLKIQPFKWLCFNYSKNLLKRQQVLEGFLWSSTHFPWFVQFLMKKSNNLKWILDKSCHRYSSLSNMNISGVRCRVREQKEHEVCEEPYQQSYREWDEQHLQES
jgi:hypothetical protein